MMKVHHLNCGTLCPVGGAALAARGLIASAESVCHCLLIEGREALVVVDTGLGLGDIENHIANFPFWWRASTRPKLSPAETAVRQVQSRGFDPRDVRHLVMTHLDLDHAGGIPDFPQATVHVSLTERDAALGRPHWRYCRDHFRSHTAWHTYGGFGERWFGFDGVRAAVGTDDEILLIPIPGHTLGHCGVAIRTPAGWLLHAGDAYFHHEQVFHSADKKPKSRLGNELFQRLFNQEHTLAMANMARLVELAKDSAAGVTIFCAHDHQELARFNEL